MPILQCHICRLEYRCSLGIL